MPLTVLLQQTPEGSASSKKQKNYRPPASSSSFEVLAVATMTGNSGIVFAAIAVALAVDTACVLYPRNTIRPIERRLKKKGPKKDMRKKEPATGQFLM